MLRTLAIILHFVRAHWRWRWLRGARLRRFQQRRGQRLARWVAQRSPFYRRHWHGHAVQHWQTLPTVDKALMMQHFDAFNTVGVQREAALAAALRAERERDWTPRVGPWTVGLSSGTSGYRGLFLLSQADQWVWAGTVLARLLHGWCGETVRVAFFLRSNSNLYETVGSGRIQFRFLDVMTPLAEAVSTLNRQQPNIIIGPPSLLLMLSEQRMQGTLGIAPTRFISVAEVLEPQDERRIAALWGVPVQQIYQSTEGFLAASCAHGRLHVQEDSVKLHYEPLGDDPLRVNIVVTDLWRRVQPIIRYRLNDVLRLSPAPCPCGSPWQVIAAIEGRADDVCFFPEPDGTLRPFFPDTLRRMVLFADDAITDYLVEQPEAGAVRVWLTVALGADFAAIAQAVKAQIEAGVVQYGCQTPVVDVIQHVPPLAPGTKRRRVQRLG